MRFYSIVAWESLSDRFCRARIFNERMFYSQQIGSESIILVDFTVLANVRQCSRQLLEWRISSDNLDFLAVTLLDKQS
jgi:hypothetical protein